MPKIYDLQNLTMEQAQTLSRIFTDAVQADIHFWEPDALKAHDIQLSHAVLRRESNSQPGEARYELLGERIFPSEGKAAPKTEAPKTEVYKVSGTLALNADGFLYKPAPKANGKTRIIKKILASSGDDEITKESAEREYSMTALAGDFGVKKPVWNKDAAYLTRREAKGMALNEILFHDSEENPKLTTEQRIKISLALLNALKKLSDKKIIHRNIAPENISIDLASHTAIIFDFKLSTVDEKNKEFSGIIPFAPPEIFYPNVDQTPKMDVYSLGRVLSLLWRLDDPYKNTTINEYKIDCLSAASNLSSLFTGIENQVTQEQKTLIHNALYGMLKSAPDERFDLDKAFEQFNKLEPERKTPAQLATAIGLMGNRSGSLSPAASPSQQQCTL